jgi:hypothetical protein
MRALDLLHLNWVFANGVFVTALPQPVDGEGPKTFVRKA